MFIKYDEYKLLEFFGQEPIIIFEKEQGDFIYSTEDENGFKITMLLSTYECKCNISLSHCDYTVPLIEYNLSDVISIDTDEEKMSISYSNKILSVYNIPHFYIRDNIS